MARKELENTKKKTRGRGRPRKSDLPANEQAKLRMRLVREQKREKRLVPVEVWIPQATKNILQKHGEDLSASAREAFELLIKKRNY